MDRNWREIVTDLAGGDAWLNVTDGAEMDANVIAELAVPGAVFRRRGDDEEDAWRGVAHALGDVRLVQSLEAGGWSVVEEVIDETTYIVARAPDGTVWAIGVASDDGDRRGYLETDMRRDDRAQRIAFVEPLDTRDSASLFAALERAD